jgi:hypothetical protein
MNYFASEDQNSKLPLDDHSCVKHSKQSSPNNKPVTKRVFVDKFHSYIKISTHETVLFNINFHKQMQVRTTIHTPNPPSSTMITPGRVGHILKTEWPDGINTV